MSFLWKTKGLIDFANKVAYFRAKVTELKGRDRMPPVSIAIHRSRAFEESFRQLKPKPAAEMRGALQVCLPPPVLPHIVSFTVPPFARRLTPFQQ